VKEGGSEGKGFCITDFGIGKTEVRIENNGETVTQLWETGSY